MNHEHLHNVEKGCEITPKKQWGKDSSRFIISGAYCKTHRIEICRCGWEWQWHDGTYTAPAVSNQERKRVRSDLGIFSTKEPHPCAENCGTMVEGTKKVCFDCQQKKKREASARQRARNMETPEQRNQRLSEWAKTKNVPSTT